MKFLSKVKCRMASDRGDSSTVANLLWIVLALVAVIGVGSLLYSAIMQKGEETAEQINNSNDLFKGK